VGTRKLTVEHARVADFISKNIYKKQYIEAPPPGPKFWQVQPGKHFIVLINAGVSI